MNILSFLDRGVNSIARRLGMSRTALAFAALMTACIFIRVVIIFLYTPLTSADTPSYEGLASQIRSLNFTGYDAGRTPGYPLLIALAGMNRNRVRVIQSILGVAISAMLFAVTWYRTRSDLASLIAGLLYSVSLNELFFEQLIYSEALCSFWVTLSLFLFARMWLLGKTTRVNFVILGVVATMAGMTRPVFLFLPLLCAAFMLMLPARERAGRARLMPSKLVAAPMIVLTLAWCTFNKIKLDYFGPTTLTGIFLTDHSGEFMELAPDKYANVRDIYLRFRAQQIARTGSFTGTIWHTGDAMRNEAGLSGVAESRVLTRMSVELFIAHPILYAKTVVAACVQFFKPALYWDTNNFSGWRSALWFTNTWLDERPLLIAMNVLFLIVAAWSMARRVFAESVAETDFDLCVIVVVLTTCVLAGCMEYGDNGRFAVPVQPLIAYSVVVFLYWKIRGAFVTPVSE